MKLTRREESSPTCATWAKKETIAACNNVELQIFTKIMINKKSQKKKKIFMLFELFKNIVISVSDQPKTKSNSFLNDLTQVQYF